MQAIALLIFTLMQKRIRDSLAKAERPLQVSWRDDMPNPPAQIILDIRELIEAITASIGLKCYKTYTRLSDDQRYILEPLSLDPMISSVPSPT